MVVATTKPFGFISQSLIFTILSAKAFLRMLWVMLITILIVFVPRVSDNYGKRSFYYCGAILWNNLNSTVIEAVSLSLFKKLYFQ